jgi:formylmethanofuran--tetrahydromethanopterin N-formyltransferase
MRLGNTLIVDTFAEAFRMRYARLIVTAADEHCLDDALREFTGYGSSVIACDAEVGVERRLTTEETPDGRPGAAVLAFGFSVDALAKAMLTRTGQCLLPCATTAVFNGLALEAEERAGRAPSRGAVDPLHGSAGASPSQESSPIEIEATVPLGRSLRYFGDGYQKSKLIADRRYWRIPVMDGEFLVEESLGVAKGIAGGNIIIQARTQAEALAAARRAVRAIADTPGVITPFPGGMVRSGSKVGSRYKALRASTNDAFCPTLRGRVESQLVEGAHAAYEIVINGVDEACIASAMRACIEAASTDGVLAISAGNYGGKLGKFHFHLHKIMQ